MVLEGLEGVLKSVSEASDTPVNRRGFMIGGLAALAAAYLGITEVEAQDGGGKSNHPNFNRKIGSAPYLNDYITTELLVLYLALNNTTEEIIDLKFEYESPGQYARMTKEKISLGNKKIEINYNGPGQKSRVSSAIILMNNTDLILEYLGSGQYSRLTGIKTKKGQPEIDIRFSGSGQFSRFDSAIFNVNNNEFELVYQGPGQYSRLTGIKTKKGQPEIDLKLDGPGQNSTVFNIKGRFGDYKVNIEYIAPGQFSTPTSASGSLTRITN